MFGSGQTPGLIKRNFLLSAAKVTDAEARSDLRREVAMNRDRLQGKWMRFGGFVREHWGRLTNDRLCAVAGRHNRLAGSARKQYGIFKEQARRELKRFLKRNRRWAS
jgi:uncharacterized protein YjbJ (UPF0337 family)